MPNFKHLSARILPRFMYAHVSLHRYNCFLIAHSFVLASITGPFSKWMTRAVRCLPVASNSTLRTILNIIRGGNYMVKRFEIWSHTCANIRDRVCPNGIRPVCILYATFRDFEDSYFREKDLFPFLKFSWTRSEPFCRLFVERNMTTLALTSKFSRTFKIVFFFSCISDILVFQS